MDIAILALARWVHFGAVMILFGAALFRMYSVGLSSLSTRLQTIIPLIAVVSALLWLGASIVMTTDNVASLWDSETLAAYLFDTRFGKVWLLRISILALIVGLVCFCKAPVQTSKLHSIILLVLAASLLVSQAWLGHAAAASAVGHWLPVTSYAIHVVAAGAWLGGIPPLAVFLKTPNDKTKIEATLNRFSIMGIASVSLILGSGMANTFFIVGPYRKY